MYAYHPYSDLSKRKPYICSICHLDITHPIHQPSLPFHYTPPPIVCVEEDEEEDDTRNFIQTAQLRMTF